MLGVLLESGNIDRYLPLGRSGHPVHSSAQQILAVLQRHPQLQPFFSVPQRNEKGSVIDWYSPVKGSVIPWSSASPDEREQARLRLQTFCREVEELGKAQMSRGQASDNADMVLFGELLQEACKVPNAHHIYLVDAEASAPVFSSSAAGATASVHASGLGQRSPDSLGGDGTNLQPVLTFWGFVNNDDDRHSKPLYFLEPQKLAPQLATPVVQSLPPVPPPPIPTPEPIPTPIPPVVEEPWWRRWWWLLLLIPLLLLLLWLLRGCVPSIPKPALPSFTGQSSTPGKPPEIVLPNIGADPAVVKVPSADLHVIAGSGTVLGSVPPAIASPAVSVPQGQGVAPSAVVPNPVTPPEAPALVPPVISPAAATATVPGGAAPPAVSAPPVPMEIPKNAPNGTADFLNGKYQTRGGLMDDQTSTPLSLHYDFTNGAGSVEVKRANGVSCKGSVNAAMTQGVLGIDSQNLASCSDGNSYEMPKINCESGAQSVADCMAVYQSKQFPIRMQTN